MKKDRSFYVAEFKALLGIAAIIVPLCLMFIWPQILTVVATICIPVFLFGLVKSLLSFIKGAK
jgi:hypothetical protein